MGVARTFRSKQTTALDSDRVAIAGFAPTTSVDDPIATAICATNTDRLPLCERAAGAIVTVTADNTVTGKVFLPALQARRWALFENLSDDTEIEWCFGTSVTAGAAFRLGPRGRVFLAGDLPNDAVRVITVSGSANLVGQQS